MIMQGRQQCASRGKSELRYGSAWPPLVTRFDGEFPKRSQVILINQYDPDRYLSLAGGGSAGGDAVADSVVRAFSKAAESLSSG